ncbi:MAG: 2,3-bisphosphoglycerate-independent phosphoglycerate mutase [Cenarchaeum sp. SB0663_bin_5]|nr:2,3-bisphosphoglycerate-independent phosphoglycerate mutase [Cenarchaeum sp. SB0663_bin_5]MYH03504.1 2,3-bisphosphoglycerate-independent phosphoglycerate mutase [Cenarchaeum sp. SB0675_bin_21]MYL10646.1 2,3-bisphosphoglycerate-independent phosphoglycerate mutase [Cenarchaeum sp. SB0669_bin_11]
MIYVLLDGVGDLPHPDLDGITPLEAASTPNLDQLCKDGALGEVISVGRGIAPESDIAVFNMLGYKFSHADYVGRGVIESIGVGLDFQDGDLALRGNFATMDDSGVITDRRAGRVIKSEESVAIAKELEDNIQFSDGKSSVKVVPTVGHRVTVVLRSDQPLSGRITNTDPAYSNVGGMGIAKAVGDVLRIDRCLPMVQEANHSAQLINEFTEQSIRIMKNSKVNAYRQKNNQKSLSCILLRDAGSKYPVLIPIDRKYSMKFSCIVDMPVEQGIAKVLNMKGFEGGDSTDYTQKARVAAEAMQTQNANYVHIKGPDVYGHDGDANGKTKNIQDIDKNFFGPLLDRIDIEKVAVVVSADHSTPCINKAHSDDPVPLLVSGRKTRIDSTSRMTEAFARQGRIGLLEGSQVLSTAIDIIQAQR